MSEPTDVPGPEAVEPSTPPQAAEPAQPWGEYAAPGAAPVLPSAVPVGPVRSGDPLRGVLAGSIAAVVGAAAWALLVAVTHYEIAIVAVLVGTLVGWAFRRFGGAPTPRSAITAAVLGALGIYLGFLFVGLVEIGYELNGGVLDGYQAVGDQVPWGTFLSKSVQGTGWLFLAVGAYGAWRIAGQPRRHRSRLGRAQRRS
jgi:hypothetical protein